MAVRIDIQLELALQEVFSCFVQMHDSFSWTCLPGAIILLVYQLYDDLRERYSVLVFMDQHRVDTQLDLALQETFSWTFIQCATIVRNMIFVNASRGPCAVTADSPLMGFLVLYRCTKAFH